MARLRYKLCPIDVWAQRLDGPNYGKLLRFGRQVALIRLIERPAGQDKRRPLIQMVFVLLSKSRTVPNAHADALASIKYVLYGCESPSTGDSTNIDFNKVPPFVENFCPCTLGEHYNFDHFVKEQERVFCVSLLAAEYLVERTSQVVTVSDPVMILFPAATNYRQPYFSLYKKTHFVYVNYDSMIAYSQKHVLFLATTSFSKANMFVFT